MSNSTIVDRRLNGKNRSLPNRERFIRRYKSQLKKAVSDVAGESSISDVSGSDKVKVRIPSKEVDEPHFVFGEGGDTEKVIPGNRDFVPGDHIPRPRGGQGQGGGGDAGEGSSEDAFTFVLSREEFLNLYFDDLELPELLKRDIAALKTMKSRNAGFSRTGAPTSLSVVRTMKASLMRRVAMEGVFELDEEEDEAKEQENKAEPNDQKPTHKRFSKNKSSEKNSDSEPNVPMPLAALSPEETDEFLLIKNLPDAPQAKEEKKKIYVPFLDDVDLRYRHRVQYPEASTNAVMFCLMDVSASMDETKKDLAKRFYTLLYLFLNQKYESVELVFVRHTDEAEEVDEEEFFHGRKSGGTEIYPAVQMINDIMTDRYPPSLWNIYLAQASDGDATSRDAKKTAAFLREKLVPNVRYYAYVETMPTPMFGMAKASDLWEYFEPLEEEFDGHFAMRKLFNRRDIYPVFRGLFEKKSSAAFGR